MPWSLVLTKLISIIAVNFWVQISIKLWIILKKIKNLSKILELQRFQPEIELDKGINLNNLGLITTKWNNEKFSKKKYIQPKIIF